MRYDGESRFSNAQAITATAVSQDVVRVPRNFGNGRAIPLEIILTTAKAGSGTVTVTAQAATTATGSYSDIQTLDTIPANAVADGTRYNAYLQPGAVGNNNYLRLNYTVTGSVSAGAVNAGVVLAHQNLEQNPAAVSIG